MRAIEGAIDEMATRRIVEAIDFAFDRAGWTAESLRDTFELQLSLALLRPEGPPA